MIDYKNPLKKPSVYFFFSLVLDLRSKIATKKRQTDQREPSESYDAMAIQIMNTHQKKNLYIFSASLRGQTVH